MWVNNKDNFETLDSRTYQTVLDSVTKFENIMNKAYVFEGMQEEFMVNVTRLF